MPIEPPTATPAPRARALDNPRVRRILRVVIAGTLATVYSQYVNWSYSFPLVILATTFVTSPAPAPSLGVAVSFLATFFGFIGLGLALLLPLHYHQLVGLALVGLIVFAWFYLLAQGKVSGMFTTPLFVSVVMIPAFGATDIDTGVLFAKGLSKAVLAMFPVVWIAYALLPEGVFRRMPPAPRIEGSSLDRAVLALRPVVVTLPLYVFMQSSDNATRYLTGMLLIATLLPPAARAVQRTLTIDAMLATLIGAAASVAIWWLTKLHPSLLWFTLLMALFFFIVGMNVFTNDPGGMSPHDYRWTYAVTTLAVMILPVTQSGGFGDAAAQKIYLRILDVAIVTFYVTVGTLILDAFIDRLGALRRQMLGLEA